VKRLNSQARNSNEATRQTHRVGADVLVPVHAVIGLGRLDPTPGIVVCMHKKVANYRCSSAKESSE
jgi:hypothetical protein